MRTGSVAFLLNRLAATAPSVLRPLAVSRGKYLMRMKRNAEARGVLVKNMSALSDEDQVSFIEMCRDSGRIEECLKGCNMVLGDKDASGELDILKLRALSIKVSIARSAEDILSVLDRIERFKCQEEYHEYYLSVIRKSFASINGIAEQEQKTFLRSRLRMFVESIPFPKLFSSLLKKLMASKAETDSSIHNLIDEVFDRMTEKTEKESCLLLLFAIDVISMQNKNSLSISQNTATIEKQKKLFKPVRESTKALSKHCKKILPILKKYFPLNSEEVFSTRYILLESCMLTSEADIIDDVLILFEDPKNIPNTVTASVLLLHLGRLLFEKEMYPRCRGILERSISSFEMCLNEFELGSEYAVPYTNALSMLGSSVLVMGDHIGALKYLERALEIRVKEYGESYPLIAPILLQLAIVQQKSGKPGVAEEMLDKAIELLESNREKVEENDARILLRDLAEAYQRKGILCLQKDKRAARDAFEKGLDVSKGANDAIYGHLLLDKAFLLIDEKEFEKSLPVLRKGFLIVTEKVGKSSVKYIQALHRFSLGLVALNRHSESLIYFQELIGRVRGGNVSPKLLRDVLSQYASALLACGKKNDAKLIHEEIVKL